MFKKQAKRNSINVDLFNLKSILNKRMYALQQKENERFRALGRDEFRNFLINQCVPKIKTLTQKLEQLSSEKKKTKTHNSQKRNKLKEGIEKVFTDTNKLIELIYHFYPIYRKDVIPNLGKELEARFSEKEMRFFHEAFIRFKKTDSYKNILETEESQNYLGKCFESAYTFMIKNNSILQNMLLIQGWVYNLELDKYMSHAWNEHNNFVYDRTETKEPIPIKEYYKTKKIGTKGTLKYFYDDAISFGNKSGHYGPWDTQLFDKELLTNDEFQQRFGNI